MAPAIFGPDEFRPALKSNQPEAVFSGAFHVTLDRALIRRAGNLSASFFASIFLRDKRRFFLAARCFEASAHGYLKIYYGKSSGNTGRISWAIHLHPQGWPSGPKGLQPNIDERRPAAVTLRRWVRFFNSVRQPRNGFVSRNQCRPRNPATGRPKEQVRLRGWVRFFNSVRQLRNGFVSQKFKCRLRNPATGRPKEQVRPAFGSFFQLFASSELGSYRKRQCRPRNPATGRPKEQVRLRGWVRFFNSVRQPRNGFVSQNQCRLRNPATGRPKEQVRPAFGSFFQLFASSELGSYRKRQGWSRNPRPGHVDNVSRR